MKIWFRRIFALALLSLGIAMTFLPFNETQSGSTEVEVVYLQKVNLLDIELIKEGFPDNKIIDITGPELNPDNYPDLWRAFINLGDDWIDESGDITEWIEFQELVLNGISDFHLLVFREGLISCTVNKDQELSSELPEMVRFKYLGKYNPYIKELTESDLAEFPEVFSLVNRIELRENIDYDLMSISKFKWDKMVDRYLCPINDLQTFYYNGNYYGPEYSWDTTHIDGSIEGLGKWLKIIGVIVLLIGFQIAIKFYFGKRTSDLSSIKTVLVYDLITLLFAIPAAYMTLNLVLSKTLFIRPIIEEEFILLVGVFFFIIGIPIVTRITSRIK